MTRDQKNKAKQRLEVLELRLDGINALTENMSDKGGVEIASILDETRAEIASIAKTLATRWEFLFNFIGGGWNSEIAFTKEEAIEQALFKYGHPNTQTSLRVDVTSFRVSTPTDYNNQMSTFY
jgi:hypothetical protein